MPARHLPALGLLMLACSMPLHDEQHGPDRGHPQLDLGWAGGLDAEDGRSPTTEDALAGGEPADLGIIDVSASKAAEPPETFSFPEVAPRGWVDGAPHDTRPSRRGFVTIPLVGHFGFESEQVRTVRPDLFQPGYFSLFDLLVHFSERGALELAYHFDPSLDTHVIDDLGGSADWWYEIYYQGGWEETSVHRMDYYPIKDGAWIELKPIDREALGRRFEIWRTETARRAENGGHIVVPEVRIQYPGQRLVFENVPVAAHDFRVDLLQPGVITAADVILSLADSGRITYGLRWYETIGSVVIGSYYLEQINDQRSSGMCGFVYELGEREETGRYGGNLIHVQTDIRILRSPEYVLFYWIELGPC